MLIKMNKVILIALFFSVPTFTIAQKVSSGVHNLSSSGSGAVKATAESEICIFCHTPHSSLPASPLWNKNNPGASYTLYSSSTLQAIPGQPDGSSILCLSCHDGTIALGDVISRSTDISFSGGITTMPSGAKNLSTDLSDDHPISFDYSATLASADGQLKDPSNVLPPVYLENGRLQCISCHDPHDNTNDNFLVVSKQNSELCKRCHDKTTWPSSTHSTSSATWNSSGTDPWQHVVGPFSTVAENACLSCHDPHSSAGKPILLKAAAEEDNCLDCHNGNVASTDIQTEVLKTYTHDVFNYFQVHDPSEAALSTVLHVECQDCHNPHASNNSTASAPVANGPLAGVQGINSSATPLAVVTNSYEVCYRCHGDSPSKPGSVITRQIAQNNVRLEFDPANPSYHPIEVAGQNSNVPSLIAPLTESSMIYCTDCHASNGASVPAGPHGSIYPQILKYRYETTDFTAESAANYELCYNCHSRTSILNDDSFGEHDKHIRGEDTPCSVCHDSHGISSSQGNSTNNTNLINFDLIVVGPDNMGRLRFEDRGNQTGRCYLDCHGKRHRPESY
jgi:predicted CXXCH cytochrome family protein